MAILKTKRSKWIVGSVVLVAMVVGTLFGLPSGGKSHTLPLTMASMNAAPYFAPVTPSGVVPRDVLDALLIPQNSSRTGWRNYDQGNGQYDRQINILVHANLNSTKTFFSSALKNQAWKIINTHTITNGYEILALHTGTDGYFWEVGVTMTSGGSTPGLGTQSASVKANDPGSSQVALRLLQYESA
ncbi:MAG: hypothetical protein EPN30_05155 [Actinomycetota bacterium]|nr:MAG: hypothetical protein EPN30_05155 [Actinomycetota bacterium]